VLFVFFVIPLSSTHLAGHRAGIDVIFLDSKLF
jgi:hypothetical protein